MQFKLEDLGRAMYAAHKDFEFRNNPLTGVHTTGWSDLIEEVREDYRNMGLVSFTQFQGAMVATGFMGLLQDVLKMLSSLRPIGWPNTVLGAEMQAVEKVIQSCKDLSIDEDLTRRLLLGTDGEG